MTARKELWEYEPYLFEKEVIRSKPRRRTKTQVVALFRKGGKQLSPVVDTEVRESADNVKENVPYQITNVEDIVTDVQQYSGLRVSLVSAKGEEGGVVLWKRKVTGKGSKLGVFIVALGNNTDRWLRKWVIFKTWENRNRVLEVVSAPVPKAPKVVKTKAA